MREAQLLAAIFFLRLLFSTTAAAAAAAEADHGREALLIVGNSGVGKSTATNLLIGVNGSSPEGDGAHSATKLPMAFTVQTACGPTTRSTLFCPPLLVIDTPGFWDTGDLSADDITTLIRSELFRQQLSSLASVLLVVDGSEPRLHLAHALESTLTMLGPDVLPFVTVVISKADLARPGGVTSDKVLKHAQQVFVAAGGEARRVVLVDFKTRPRASTIEALSEALPRGVYGGYALAGIDDLARKEEQYLADELALEANMVTRSYQVPRVESRTVTKTVAVDVAFTYECNCQKVCTKRLFGACLKKKKECGTCAGTRQETRQLTELVHETVNDIKITKELANSVEFYREKAKRRVLDELHAAVFHKKSANEAGMSIDTNMPTFRYIHI
jgi:GTP-binding protein EngB required for normal cell division